MPVLPRVPMCVETLDSNFLQSSRNLSEYCLPRKPSRRCGPRLVLGGGLDVIKPEARFLQCGKDKLSTVMSKILSKGKPQKKSENSQSVSIDELAIEESKAYSEKLSRWKKRTKQCLEDPLWWRVLETMQEARGPLAHLSHFLHQKQQGQFNHVATLCTGKASTIFEEFLEVWPKLVKIWMFDWVR